MFKLSFVGGEPQALELRRALEETPAGQRAPELWRAEREGEALEVLWWPWLSRAAIATSSGVVWRDARSLQVALEELLGERVDPGSF